MKMKIDVEIKAKNIIVSSSNSSSNSIGSQIISREKQLNILIALIALRIYFSVQIPTHAQSDFIREFFFVSMTLSPHILNLICCYFFSVLIFQITVDFNFVIFLVVPFRSILLAVFSN